MKKLLLCGAALLMLSPTAVYAKQTENTSQIYPIVANSTVANWDQLTEELAKQIQNFETDIKITYTGKIGDLKKEMMDALEKAKQQAVYASGHIESTMVSADSLGNVTYKMKYLTSQTQEVAVQKKD